MIHDTIKQRLRASLLLTPPPKAAQASAMQHAASMQADGSWGDLPAPTSLLAGSAKPAHLERTLLLAKALRPAAGALDDPLRRALDLWLAHDFVCPNWRDNQIVIPRLIGEIALLYDNGLSAGAAGKVMEILARSRWAEWIAPVGWLDRSGMDLLGIAYNQLLRGCSENAPSLFDTAFGRIFREIRLAGPGELGIQADMTFQTPPGELSGGGFSFVRACAHLIALAHGTPWQAPAETVKLFAGFILDGQQWLMRQGTVDTGAPHDVFTEVNDLPGIAAVIQQLAQLGNPPRRSELAAFAHRLQGRGEALSGHRYFWRNRMSVHQRPAFYASVRLGTASFGGEISPSTPVTDGQTFILRSGREYLGLGPSTRESPSSGVTTFLGPERLASENAVHPAEDPSRWLSGGVSEGECGLAATELRRPGLSGKKAWFFFDESFVCLGADLHSSHTNHPVCTTINHCRSQGTVAVRRADGVSRSLPPDEEHALTSIRAVEHDGIHYVFPQASSVLLRSSSETSDCAPADVTFHLRIDHGSQPKGASSCCIVLPTGDDPEAAARAAEEVNRIEILANSHALQAVRHGVLGLVGAVFWEPGVVLLPGGGRIAANHACLLLCRDVPGGGTRLSISNPTSKAATVHVEYGGQCVCFELPGGADAGRSLSRLL